MGLRECAGQRSFGTGLQYEPVPKVDSGFRVFRGLGVSDIASMLREGFRGIGPFHIASMRLLRVWV